MLRTRERHGSAQGVPHKRHGLSSRSGKHRQRYRLERIEEAAVDLPDASDIERLDIVVRSETGEGDDEPRRRLTDDRARSAVRFAYARRRRLTASAGCRQRRRFPARHRETGVNWP